MFDIVNDFMLDYSDRGLRKKHFTRSERIELTKIFYDIKYEMFKDTDWTFYASEISSTTCPLYWEYISHNCVGCPLKEAGHHMSCCKEWRNLYSCLESENKEYFIKLYKRIQNL